MKKELTIEHLAAYLPYQPLIGWHDEGHKCIIDLQMVAKHGASLANYRMCLRPLSDLTKEITHNGKTFVPTERFSLLGYRVNPSIWEAIGVFSLPYWVVCELHSMHFDAFGLIESGLAIDINTIDNIVDSE